MSLLRKLAGFLLFATVIQASAGTPELQAATDAALSAERAFVAVTPPTTGPAFSDVQAQLNASEARLHQEVTTEYDTLEANLAALWGTTPPPIEPPVDPPDPPPVTGAIETGGSLHVPTRITPSLNGHRFNTNSNYWNEVNRTVLNDAVDPQSDHLISLMGNGLRIHMDFFGCRTVTPRDCVGDGSNGGPIWGIPVNIVSGTHPRVPVPVTWYTSESEVMSVPMPANPSIEGWPSLVPPSDYGNNDDHHLLIAVRDEATGGIQELFELAKPLLVNGAWSASQLSYWDLRPGAGLPRKDGWTSADAAGLPMFPFMATYDEVASGVVSHPLRITLNSGAIRTRYLYPGRHAAYNGMSDDGIPFGGRLRLKQSWYDANKDTYTGSARVLLDAMRNYGVINADIGGMGFLTGISDDRFDDANLMTLQNVPWSAFEVLKLVPQFDVVGPTTVAVGVSAAYSLKFNPLVEENGAHGYYLHAYKKNPDGVTWARIPDTPGVQPHQISYTTPTNNSPNFTFVAPSAGEYVLEVDQAGESKLEWTPGVQIQTTTDGVRGPYPYFHVTAQ